MEKWITKTVGCSSSHLRTLLSNPRDWFIGTQAHYSSGVHVAVWEDQAETAAQLQLRKTVIYWRTKSFSLSAICLDRPGRMRLGCMLPRDTQGSHGIHH